MTCRAKTPMRFASNDRVENSSGISRFRLGRPLQAWTRAQIRKRQNTLVKSARESKVACGGRSYNLYPAGCASLRQGSGRN